MHEPTVVLLDEPYTGLDAVGGAALTEILRLLRSHGATLVLVTHNVDEGLALATDAAVMLDGKFVRFERAQSIDAAQYVTDYRALLALLIPFIHLSVYLFPTLHPMPIVLKPERPSLSPEMLTTFLLSFAAFTLLVLALIRSRYRLASLGDAVRATEGAR